MLTKGQQGQLKLLLHRRGVVNEIEVDYVMQWVDSIINDATVDDEFPIKRDRQQELLKLAEGFSGRITR